MPRLTAVLAALAALCTQAHATTINAGAAVNGTAGPAGLSGTFYDVAWGRTGYDIADTLTSMRSATPLGTFTATQVYYSGGDSSTVTSFLGSDGGSYRGRTAAAYDLSDGIFNLMGYLYVSAAGTNTFQVYHDDSAQLTIGGQTIISANCCGLDQASVTFQAPGYYALNLVYANTYASGSGGATLALGENGALIPTSNLVQSVRPVSSVPEPASAAVFGIGLAGMGTLLRRRRSSRAAS